MSNDDKQKILHYNRPKVVDFNFKSKQNVQTAFTVILMSKRISNNNKINVWIITNNAL